MGGEGNSRGLEMAGEEKGKGKEAVVKVKVVVGEKILGRNLCRIFGPLT